MVEDHDRGLVGVPVAVLREERDELDGEALVRQVGGHRAEEALHLRHERRDPRRHGGAAAGQIGERPGHGVDQLVQVEQPLDVGPRQHEH